ncbi:DUF3137 domain-containing protein [Cellulomonas soli]|uniref:DUF3137 domain-containing protein n=1 Tax=Cellulomonas soli TaxID=931535 RepID=A0A512PC60_9CELL|nr:DUF3137 domain-containing protein [Cellulomonas soli]NYI58372.1 hypothetical protein [Cellulomonas soli]GEP68793.1 hypothetical protein CSO01_15080 [Cellulomonas soli]
MNGVPGAFVVYLVPLIGLGLLGLGWWLQHQRRQQLQQWAQRNGWTYADRDDSYVRVQRGQPFEQGHARRATEVMTGRFEGMPAISFDYQWDTGSGKEETTHHAHVVALALPAYLPTLEVTPEGFGARFAKMLGAQDMQFESEDFNRAYRVAAGDQRTAHAVLHPRLMERLLRPDAVRTPWRIEGTWIVSWTSGGTDLSTLAARLGLLTAVVRSVPRHVWLDHGYDPSSPENLRKA